MISPHLHVSISSHGYGHGAMTLAVLDGLCEHNPNIRISISTSLPETWIRSRFNWEFTLYPPAEGDFGMRMISANEVHVSESAAAYAALHQNWGDLVDAQAEVLNRIKPDLLLSNVSYLPLAGAKKIGLPCLGFGPFTWVDIFEHYCSDEEGARGVINQMMEAYGGTELFLKPAPSIEIIKGPERVLTIGPIGQVGRDRGDDLHNHLNIDPNIKIGLIAFGGMEGEVSTTDWPQISGWFWISGNTMRDKRSDMVSSKEIPINFVDLIASSNVVVTKPGYNTFVEAAFVGVPVITLERRDWPEWGPLIEWIKTYCPTYIANPLQLRDQTVLTDILSDAVYSHRGGGDRETKASQKLGLNDAYAKIHTFLNT